MVYPNQMFNLRLIRSLTVQTRLISQYSYTLSWPTFIQPSTLSLHKAIRSANSFATHAKSTECQTNELRILVPVKRVIDYAIKPRISSNGLTVETAGVKHSMNPFDEIALEEAVRLRERSSNLGVSEIVAVSVVTLPASDKPVTSPAATDTLRTALAMGCDRAILLTVSQSALVPSQHDSSPASSFMLTPLSVAKILAAIARRENFNMVLMGKQAIDDDAGQTGGILAGLLDWPAVTQAASVTLKSVKDSPISFTITRESDTGVETLESPLPLLITTDLRLNEPRYATLPNIMKAKKKPLEIHNAIEYLPELPADAFVSQVSTIRIQEAPPRSPGEFVQSVDELIVKLKEKSIL